MGKEYSNEKPGIEDCFIRKAPLEATLEMTLNGDI